MLHPPPPPPPMLEIGLLVGGEREEEEESMGSERVQFLVEEKGLRHIPQTFLRPPEERPSLAHDAFSHRHAIPLIDLNALDGERRGQIREQMGKACQEWGIFHILNHGVPSAVIDDIRNAAVQFFRLPMQEKLQYACKAGAMASEGYGNKMLVKDEQVQDWRDYFDHHTLPLSRRNPSNWPKNPTFYRAAIENYSNEMLYLAKRLLAVISESLGLDKSYIENAIGEPYQNISINYYPPCPQPDLTLGFQSHSDMGAITLLMQDDVGGLQIFKDGEWIAVKPVPNALVVNLCDQIQILSNGKYRSVEHRAVVNTGRARMSIATFYDPSKDIRISPAPELTDDEHPPLYREVLYRDHVSTFYSRGPDGKGVLESLLISR
ncbi:hypothetical protein O6H91_01G103100 [Diphasiastrum complanatum]|uniref:Uncharacterized protein n=1 Tax=Diphasiastrum complanatum TaxID=34168 RepID=A0ACC2ETV8_DIPCM|nr:hypothetical protein O6H91_01G103100 [Diphasiastrum complanatum]